MTDILFLTEDLRGEIAELSDSEQGKPERREDWPGVLLDSPVAHKEDGGEGHETSPANINGDKS
jgi:hypothetical protein